MRTGFIISLLMHTAVILAVVVGLPRFSGEPDPIMAAIPVTVISEADLARLDVLPLQPATLVEPPQIELPEEPPPPPETELAALPPVPVERPEPPQVEPDLPELREPEPPPEAQLAPEPVVPDLEPPPPAAPEPMREPEVEPETEPEPAPEPELEPEPEPEPELTPDLAEEPEPVTEIAEDVTPEPVAAEDPPETQVATLPVPPAPPLPPRRPEPPQADAEPEPRSTFGSLLSSLARGTIETSRSRDTTRLPPALEQAVRETVKRCWHIDPSARLARETVVELDIDMRPDGTVVDAEVVDRSRYNSDPVFRSAANRARRAVLNPSCQPWPLPASTFDDWQEITMNFDPRDFFF